MKLIIIKKSIYVNIWIFFRVVVIVLNLFHYNLETPVLHPVTKFPSPSSKRAAG